MIRLLLGSANSVVLTLTELTTITDPFYIVDFVNRTTNETVTITLGEDTSLFKQRFNRFEVIPENENLQEGNYEYTIYQSVDGNTKGIVVERGLAEVVGTPFTYETHGSDNTFITPD
jgi:hypothetical protein